jgi:hypothetical protein
MNKILMPILKPLMLAATIVVGLSPWADAATRHHRYADRYGSASANTNATEKFQEQFDIDY